VEKSKTVLEVLKEARALIARGWCKGDYCNTDGSKVCVLGAINKVINGDPRNESCPVGLKKVKRDVELSLLKNCPAAYNLSEFNDSRKSKRAVLKVFDKAIRTFKEQSK
jgi:hypothetical protein